MKTDIVVSGRKTTMPSVRLVSVALLAVALVAPPTAARAEKSDNVSVVERFRYRGGDGLWVGSDLDFAGDYAYSGQLGRGGGIHIYNISWPRPRRGRVY